MSKPPSRIRSEHALLDVTTGRAKLANALGYTGGDMRIPVTIKGFLTYAWGRDDGESQEFAVDVTDVELGS